MTSADRQRLRQLVDHHKRNRIHRSKTGRDQALDHAAYTLFRMAGRPDTMWDSLSEHERDGWRECFRVSLAAFMGHDEVAA